VIMKKHLGQFAYDKRGMTLPEMLVAVFVLALLLGIISTLLMKSFYINRFTIEQGLNTAEVQKTVRTFTKNLREAKQADDGAYMLETAEDFELVFYSNIDSDQETERLHYYLEDNKLKLGTTEAAGFPLAYPESDDEVKIIGNGVVNNESQPLFYYYNREYPIDTVSNPLATPPDIQEVGMVMLDIYVNVNTDQVPDSTHVGTFVRPRNIR